MNSAQDYLLLALAQAYSRRGFCAPNPAVGAVIVKNGEIIAEGVHQGVGTPHAEAAALAIAGANARGATLYVTLEPCNHQGRMPPCTEDIIRHGISTVYYAYDDPNTKVKGKGASRLKEAGLQIEKIAVPEIDEFYRSYTYWLKTARPFVTAKLALSLDGKIAGPQAKPIALSGEEAQHYTHEKRRCSDAILTSVRTIINDDPQLNVRLSSGVIAKPLYLVDRRADLPLNAKILKTAARLTLFHDQNAAKEKLNQLEALGVKCIQLESPAFGLSEIAIAEFIGQEGIHDLWLEAGGGLFSTFYEAQLIQRILFYLSPLVLGADAYSAFYQGYNFAQNSKINWFQLGQEGVCEILLPTAK